MLITGRPCVSARPGLSLHHPPRLLFEKPHWGCRWRAL